MTVQDVQRYLKKFPPLAKVVLTVNDDEGLVYTDLFPGAFYNGRNGLYCTLVEDAHNRNKQA